MLVSHLRKLFNINKFELRIGDVFSKYEASIVGNNLVESVGISEVGNLSFHAKASKGFCYESESIAKKVIRSDDSLTSLSKHHKSVENSSHSCVHGKNILCP